jgi:hypothetical protein
MNFGGIGSLEVLLLFVLAWGIPLTLLVWFVRTLSGMAASLRAIAERLASLERTVRDRPIDR